ncbi:NADH:flavin oxidoreductase / NADH oxidase family protein [Brugia pahangi]
MVANGILNSSKEPTTRWDCSDVDQEMVKVILGERLRFPYASNVVAPNRMMKSAMSEQLATYNKNDMKKSGIPTRELINLYEKFADGGFGTIVTGCIIINGKDIEAPGNVIIDKELDSEERRNAFKEWTQCAKRNGSIIIAQLFHPGKYAADLPHKTDFNINKLTRKQIGELINEYAYAASYAQQCGFNGVEISCTYFFALGQLITSSDNIRNDEFGGKLENRAKILFKIIQAIRMKICKPSRFVIGLKLFCGNFEPDYNNDAFGEFVHNVEKTGFDYIAITGGHYDLIKDLKRGDDPKKCEYFYQKFVLTMRKHLTRTKLFMNGGFVTLAQMLAAIHNGWAAGVSLARPVAAEPDLPKRLFAGEVKSATKSLFEPMDYSVEIKFAGSQLWQHGYLLTVMDASNPDHIEQFKKDLHLHEKQKLADDDELIIGYPKTIVHPELLDEDMLKRIQQLSKSTESTNAMILNEEPVENEPITRMDDTENVMIEEETHHVMKKQLDYGASGDLQENTVEDSIHTVVKRHENSDDIGMDIIEETIEKVILTKSDFSEPPQSEPVESSVLQDAQPDDITRNDNDFLNTTTETQDDSFSDMKTVLEKPFTEDLKLRDEMVSNVNEGLHKENEERNAIAVDNVEEQHEITLPSNEQQSEAKETAVEVISGLSDNDKPIISGIVEEVRDANDDDEMKSMEENAGNESAENPIAENEKYLMKDKEPSVEDENCVIDENVVEEVMHKEIYNISAEMTTSFMGDSMAHQIEHSSEKDNEQFANASEFHDNTEGYHEIRQSNEKDKQDYLQDHFENDVIGSHTSEGVTEAYIPKDITEDHISEGIEEDFLEKTNGTDMTKGLTDNHFENLDNGINNDSRSEAIIRKDMTVDDDKYPLAKDFNDQHIEGFIEGRINQAGWNELSNEANHYKVSSPTYSTLFGSTLMSGNGESVVYEEYYDKHSVPGQSPDETYQSEICGIPIDKAKDAKNDENLLSGKVDINQVETKFDFDKSGIDNSTTTHRHGLTGFISSAIPDSVQSLISSTRNKFGEMLSEDDGKHEPDLQFTMKTEEMIGDDGRRYEVHTESYSISSGNDRLSSDFGDTKEFLAGDADKFKSHDDNLIGGSIDTHHSTGTTITTITTMTNQGDKDTKRDGLFGDKKSTDDLDFEFIH